jgi:hypothetical protein
VKDKTTEKLKMTLHYTLEENDFLTHQLFTASKSERIRKKRKKSRLMVPLDYAGIGLFFYFQNRVELTIIFILVGLLWFLFYRIWETKHYLKHYQCFIKENYQKRIDRKLSLTIGNDFISTKDEGGESKLLVTEIAEILEIPTIILIKLKSGQSFLLPKTKIDALEEVRAYLKILSTALDIKYEMDQNWK